MIGSKTLNASSTLLLSDDQVNIAMEFNDPDNVELLAKPSIHDTECFSLDDSDDDFLPLSAMVSTFTK